MSIPTPTAPPAKRQRDLRLDFFRGLAMFIILIAHTPNSLWRMWIPARFGFSDATEIFVFCSGMASAIAFGSVFVKRSWFLGSARIVFRVWQVYWAHIGVVLATAGLMVVLQTTGMGEPGKDYTRWFPVGGFFSDTPGRPAETFMGLFTLTYIPGLFDILPMYLVILAMVPVVMAVYRAGGREAVFAFVAVVWLTANLGGYARIMSGAEDMSAFQAFFAGIGQYFTWMNLPGIPWEPNATWFFNPFGWQLVFFTGFCFAMGWIPAPPIRKDLVYLAIFVILITVPFAWYKMYQYKTGYVPESVLGRFFWDSRGTIQPVRWKNWVGAWRYVHFLAIAYLAWAAVGHGGIKLSTGWGVIQRSPLTRTVVRSIAGLLLLLTFPYTYIQEIKFVAPALDRWFFENIPLIPGRYIGLAHLVHLTALIVFIWHSIGDRWRQWLVRDAFLACVPVIRKVGTQSLAVFLVSIFFSRVMGWWMDSMAHWIDTQSGWTYITGRDVWVRGLVNVTGFGVLIATAYLVGWFKKQPWREPKDTKTIKTESRATGVTRSVPAE